LAGKEEKKDDLADRLILQVGPLPPQPRRQGWFVDGRQAFLTDAGIHPITMMIQEEAERPALRRRREEKEEKRKETL
jgi:hypothetical protein